MKLFYSLRINAKQEQSAKITTILGIEPNYPQVGWGYKIIVKYGEYFNFIDYFTSMLSGKYEKLEDIGITRDKISIWMIYEYEEQCNMEFTPEDLKKLGDNGINLCVSCYEA